MICALGFAVPIAIPKTLRISTIETVLIDPDKHWVPAEMTLRALFGFTPAEARLAAGISSGAALNTMAGSLGISKKTGRNQLMNIFAKAGVHRQAELVAMVGSTASAARGTLKPI